MAGKKILYTALILLAIGSGIYGSMNNLFRPHVYAECYLEDKPSKTATFYINEREDYLRFKTLRFDLIDKDRQIYGDNGIKIDYFPSETFGHSFFITFSPIDDRVSATSSYENCKVTRYLLQPDFVY